MILHPLLRRQLGVILCVILLGVILWIDFVQEDAIESGFDGAHILSVSFGSKELLFVTVTTNVTTRFRYTFTQLYTVQR